MADKVAIVGSETLLGRELRDLLSTHRLDVPVKLIAAPEEEAGLLTETGGELEVVAKLEPEAFEGVSVALLACSAAAAREVVRLSLPVIPIDLTYGLEETPNARLRAPMVEAHDFRVPPDATQIVAHPAAIAVALLLGRIHPVFPVARSVVHIFEPASERGTAGIEELQQQTVNLLSFKPLPKKIYDTQVSYSMLASFGEEAPLSLQEIESRIERHLASLLASAGGPPIPSLRLLQSPVFHGYTFSVWVEFENRPSVAALEQVLSEDPFDLRSADLEPPTNVGVAGQSGVSLGAITLDRGHSQGMWIWMAADNLRLLAENALLVAKEVL